MKTGVGLALVFTAILFMLLAGPTIPLGFMEARLESIASHQLNRHVTIGKPPRLTLSLYPELLLEHLSISNPDNWPAGGHLLTIEKGHGKISLMHLLRGEIQIDRLDLEGVDLQLRTRADNSTNYQFPFLDRATDDPDPAITVISLEYLLLRDVRLNYDDEKQDKAYRWTIDEADGKAAAETPMVLSAKGRLLGKQYTLDLSADPLPGLIRGTGTWSIARARLSIARTELDVTGGLDRRQDLAGKFNVSFSGADLAGIAEMFDLPLTDTGRFSAKTGIRLATGMIRLDDLELVAFGSSLRGNLELSLNGKRPALQGTLTSPKLDPAIFSSFKSREMEPATPAVEHTPRAAAIPWQLLNTLDASLHLQIDSLVPNTFEINNIQADMILNDGDLALPFIFAVQKASASGNLNIRTSGDNPVLELAFASKNLAAAPFIKTITGKDQYSGSVDAVTLAARTQGRGMQDLARSVDLNIATGRVRIDSEEGPVFTATALALTKQQDAPYLLSGDGDFLGRPFSITARAGHSVKSHDAASFSLELNACDTTLEFSMTTLQEQEKPRIDYKFSLNGHRLCGFLDPTTRFTGNSTRLVARGTGNLQEGVLSLERVHGRLGNIAINANAELKTDSLGESLITANVYSPYLDLSPVLQAEATNKERSNIHSSRDSPAEWNKAAETKDKDELTQAEKTALIKDILTRGLLPRMKLLSTDAILNMQVDKLDTGRGSASAIKLYAKLKDGKLSRSPFSFNIAAEPFTGDARADFTSEVPAIHIKVKSRGLYLPALYQEFGIDNPPEIKADHVTLKIDLKGRRIQKMIQRSSLALDIEGGKWDIPRELGGTLHIDVTQASYSTGPGKPATISIDGHANSEPLNLEMTEDGLFGKNTGKPLTLNARIRIADTELNLDSKLVRKTRADNTFRLHTTMSGTRMDRLNDILGINLPPLGPYVFEGALEKGHNNISFHDLQVRIGESVLKGGMHIEGHEDKDGEVGYPLTLTTRLNAEAIQLNDFRVGDWSAITIGAETPPPPEKTGEQQNGNGGEDTLNDLLSPELAAKLGGTVEIEVQQVLSGTDKLGSGYLSASLANGRFSLDDLKLAIPGGSILMQGSYSPGETQTSARLSMQIDHLDYGVLARRVRPDSDLKGEFNVNLNLNATADSPAAIKQHLNGYLRFGVVPVKFEAGIIDLWAINILTAALPDILKGKKSEVNCLAGDFRLDNGIMQPEVFMLDTSKIRVKGEGEVNFRTNTIDFLLRPAPKQAQFFSAATPVKISGAITKPGIGPAPGSIAGTAFHMITGLITTPFEMLFKKQIEASGKEACAAAMAWVNE